MGDNMRLVPLGELLRRMLEEYREQRSIFDIPQDSWYRRTDARTVRILNESCEIPLGPAAGPHTQLASNIVCSYLTGSRFIELKTVQILDALEIEKPCIDAYDEGYNTEWSTELSLEEAWREYAKAWILLHVVEELFDMKASGLERSFIFNMSVGYDMAGIRTEAMQRYINRMKDSSAEALFARWIGEVRTVMPALLAGTGLEEKAKVFEAFTVTGRMCRSVTLSTMHGCPPDEIEAISSHMLVDQGLDTYVKLNPTLLGYDTVTSILSGLGFGYVALDAEGFAHDLQYPQALEILARLRAVAADHGRCFGVKLTNTLATKNNRTELPGGEMYLSGRALFPLSITVASRLAEAFDGELPISFSGGITVHNAQAVFKTGIRPVTLATDLLKPGGYLRQVQIAEALDAVDDREMSRIDVAALAALARSSYTERSLHKEFRGTDEVAVPGALPLFDCYEAPCVTACAIRQHIPEYIRLVGEERYDEALECIYERNALPSITGHICDHKCQLVCTRLDYEGCLNIREVKRLAVLKGIDAYRPQRHPGPVRSEKVAVVGAGPAGLSAAYFLAREGFAVSVFERERDAGGVVRNVVPHFRIAREAIDSDVGVIRDMGVEFHFGVTHGISVNELKEKGFEFVVLGLGTYQTRNLPIGGDSSRIHPSLPFLLQYNRDATTLEMGKEVVVIGAGDTAMDCARAALRCPGVEGASIVYRRAFEQMPASREEYEFAREDDVAFRWLRSPERLNDDGTLTVRVMTLGEADASGRRRPVPTDATEEIRADSVVYAIGDDPDVVSLRDLGLHPDERGGVPTSEGGETEIENVFLIGDSRTGASTIVNCIAEGRRAADAICRRVEPDWVRSEVVPRLDAEERAAHIADKRRRIVAKPDARSDYEPARFGAVERSRCLECDFVCNKCVDVCPNRANIALPVADEELFDNPYEIVHIDAYCNECGNCGHFCPWEGLPYRDKPTVFSTAEDFAQSTNQGWLLKGDTVTVRFAGTERTLTTAEVAAAARGEDDEARFFRLFELVRMRRPHLFGPVEPTISGVPR